MTTFVLSYEQPGQSHGVEVCEVLLDQVQERLQRCAADHLGRTAGEEPQHPAVLPHICRDRRERPRALRRLGADVHAILTQRTLYILYGESVTIYTGWGRNDFSVQGYRRHVPQPEERVREDRAEGSRQPPRPWAVESLRRGFVSFVW